MTIKTPSDIDRAVGHRIKACRLERGMSQEKLAEAIGITFQQVQKYEKGANRISAGRLLTIARALGEPIVSFYEEPQEPDPESVANAKRLMKAYDTLYDERLRVQIVGLLELLADISW